MVLNYIMRLRNNPNAKEKLESSNILIKQFPIKLNNKTILEIGMGKGEMITKMALENPNKIFVGIEKFPTVALKALNKANELKLNNFFIVCEDVKNLFDKFDGEVDEIWLTFSDPWPKKRHYKKRLTYRSFLNIYKSILSNNGILKIKTDNDAFFEWSIQEIEEYGGKIIYKTNDLHNSEKNLNNIKTGYEIKWSEKGKKINYMEIIFNV